MKKIRRETLVWPSYLTELTGDGVRRVWNKATFGTVRSQVQALFEDHVRWSRNLYGRERREEI